jgi:low temperature requirement protein LtrA
MTENTTGARVLHGLLVLNGAASLAAAATLALFPTAIPGAVGISVNSSQNFILHLLAAAELSIGVLCLLAWRSNDRNAIRQAVTVLVVLHVTSGLAGIAAVVEQADPLILWNVAVRLAMVAALGWSAILGFRRKLP